MSASGSSNHERCEILLGAARLLLVRSGLVEWKASGISLRFPDQNGFEDWLKQEYDGNPYGRYHAWMQLVVGGENLVKAWGFCTNNIPQNLPRQNRVYALPPQASALESAVNAWISQVAQGSKTGGVLENFGALERWVQVMLAGPNDIRKAGARYLLERRNCEAHQYIEGTRSFRYPALTHLLVPFFNELLAEMQARSHPTP